MLAVYIAQSNDFHTAYLEGCSYIRHTISAAAYQACFQFGLCRAGRPVKHRCHGNCTGYRGADEFSPVHLFHCKCPFCRNPARNDKVLSVLMNSITDYNTCLNVMKVYKLIAIVCFVGLK
jgi:hypothetical protein